MSALMLRVGARRVLLALLPTLLLAAYAVAVPPTYVSVARQELGHEPVSVPPGPAVVVQEVRSTGEPVDAVSLFLPTEFNRLTGTLSVDVEAVGSAEVGADGAVVDAAHASVDLEKVQDWGIHVFRLDSRLPGDALLYRIGVASTNGGHVASASDGPYPEGGLRIAGAQAAADLRFMLYRKVSWGAYLERLSAVSAVAAPVWLLGFALLSAVVLFPLACWRAQFVR